MLSQRSAIAVICVCISACSTAKLEARLEANPQCRDVVNPKTGALMPCPGTDKAFYKSVGLEQTKTTPTDVSRVVISPDSATLSTEVTDQATPKPSPAMIPTTDCKPSLHKKTGGLLPCPSPN